MNAAFAIVVLTAINNHGFFMGEDAISASTVSFQKNRLRQIHVYAPSQCEGCKPVKKDLVLSMFFGKGDAERFEYVFHEEERSFPSWVHDRMNSERRTYPLVQWETEDGKWKYNSGFTNGESVLAAVSSAESDAGFAPTPYEEVERVIGLLPKPEVGFVDFGCGDARWCIAAVKRWNCRATGIEIDPARAAVAREKVRSAGLSHLITIIEGDATKVNVQADVGVAYLYGDLLLRLKPKFESLRAFASYMHQPPGLPVVQNGSTFIYYKPVVQQQQYATYQRQAEWQGYYYSQPVCNNPGCAMCNAIRRQLSR